MHIPILSYRRANIGAPIAIDVNDIPIAGVIAEGGHGFRLIDKHRPRRETESSALAV